MSWTLKSPCGSCPYRVDAPLALWSPEEFILLKENDHPHGSTFGCHGTLKKPEEEREPCVGWLLDQRVRNTPNITLRILLMTDPAKTEMYQEITDGGHKLYGSIDEMIRANYGRGHRKTETQAQRKRRLKLL